MKQSNDSAGLRKRALLQNVVVSAGQTTELPSSEMVPAWECDINGDNKIGLEEIIYSLQVIAGLRPED